MNIENLFLKEQEVAVDKIANCIASILLIALTLLPFWVWLLVTRFVEPHTFWQKLIAIGAGVYFLGALQLFLLCVLVVGLIAIWSKPR